MISSRYKFIYLHAPKTGGNSIQSVLLPFSDDNKQLGGHRDGHDRFEVSGAITPHKHASLSVYCNALGQEISNYRVAISVRHPIERAVSYYFSPHRWIFKNENTSEWEPKSVYWNLDAFEKCLNEIVPMADFITVDGEIQKPDFVIRYENLEEDFKTFVSTVGIDENHEPLPNLNNTTNREKFLEALESNEARKLVEKQFASDYDFFNY